MKNKKLLTGIFIASLLFLVVGISLALYFSDQIGGDNAINTGTVSFTYTEPSNRILINNALPIPDAEGKVSTEYFEFSVTSNATTNADDDKGVEVPYEISLSPVTIDNMFSKLKDSDIKVYLTRLDGDNEVEVVSPIKISELSNSEYRDNAFKILKEKDSFHNNMPAKTTRYRLRFWIDYSVDSSNWSDENRYQYRFVVNVNAKTNTKSSENKKDSISLYNVEKTYDKTINPYEPNDELIYSDFIYNDNNYYFLKTKAIHFTIDHDNEDDPYDPSYNLTKYNINNKNSNVIKSFDNYYDYFGMIDELEDGNYIVFVGGDCNIRKYSSDWTLLDEVSGCRGARYRDVSYKGDYYYYISVENKNGGGGVSNIFDANSMSYTDKFDSVISGYLIKLSNDNYVNIEDRKKMCISPGMCFYEQTLIVYDKDLNEIGSLAYDSDVLEIIELDEKKVVPEEPVVPEETEFSLPINASLMGPYLYRKANGTYDEEQLESDIKNYYVNVLGYMSAEEYDSVTEFIGGYIGMLKAEFAEEELIYWDSGEPKFLSGKSIDDLPSLDFIMSNPETAYSCWDMILSVFNAEIPYGGGEYSEELFNENANLWLSSVNPYIELDYGPDEIYTLDDLYIDPNEEEEEEPDPLDLLLKNVVLLKEGDNNTCSIENYGKWEKTINNCFVGNDFYPKIIKDGENLIFIYFEYVNNKFNLKLINISSDGEEKTTTIDTFDNNIGLFPPYINSQINAKKYGDEIHLFWSFIVYNDPNNDKDLKMRQVFYKLTPEE